MSCNCATLKGEKCKNKRAGDSQFCHRHAHCENVYAKVAKAKVAVAKVVKTGKTKAPKVPKLAKTKAPKAVEPKVVKSPARSPAKSPKAKPPKALKKFDHFDALPIPVLSTILMGMERAELNAICNSNKRIKRLICDDKGWRNQYLKAHPGGLFHLNAMYDVTREKGPRTAGMPLPTKPLIFRELRDVPIEAPKTSKSSPELKKMYDEERDQYISNWRKQHKSGQWYSHLKKDIEFVSYRDWLKDLAASKRFEAQKVSPNRSLNDFDVTLVLDRKMDGEVTEVRYHQNAVRANRHAAISRARATIELYLRKIGTQYTTRASLELRGMSLEEFLKSINKPKWQKHMTKGASYGDVTHYSIGSPVIVEFYTLVKAEVERVAVYMKPVHQNFFMPRIRDLQLHGADPLHVPKAAKVAPKAAKMMAKVAPKAAKAKVAKAKAKAKAKVAKGV